MSACGYCDGHGTVVLNKSHFTCDGYTLGRCGVCHGSKVSPPNFLGAGGDWNARQKKKRANIKIWGGMAPPAPADEAGGRS